MIRLVLAQQAPQAPRLPPLPHPDLPIPETVALPTPWYWYALGIGIVVVLLALVIWLLVRKRRQAPPPLPQHWDQAMEALRNLRLRADVLPPPETAHAVSETLRRYFWTRYRIPAPFRTRRELFERETPGKSERVARYAPLAALWDELGFAPNPSSGQQALELVERAITYLEEDRP